MRVPRFLRIHHPSPLRDSRHRPLAHNHFIFTPIPLGFLLSGTPCLQLVNNITAATASPPSPPSIDFSSNTDPATSLPRVAALLQQTQGSESGKSPSGADESEGRSSLKWILIPDARGLRREFKFNTFKTTWAFMNTVAQKCAEERHHPEWTNRYNKVTITWTTHRPQGLSHKDLTMAEFCDEQARIYGEEAPENLNS